MKSIISEALERAEQEERLKQSASIPVDPNQSPDDAELEKILESLRVNIKIFGCGGGGSNTVNRLVESGMSGAELYALNTDAAHLLNVHAPHKILIGRRCTRGLGAGAEPHIGEEAAKEAEDELRMHISGADIVFVTCGLGGGTGTGAAPYVAKMAKDAGSLVLAVVTMPFSVEGRNRTDNAEWGLNLLTKFADTVLLVPNDKLLEVAPKLPLDKAFKVADEVLMRSIKGITEIITKPGMVNLDFNDLKTIMSSGGLAMVGIGVSDDMENKAKTAVEAALNSPLLDVDTSNATGALVSVVGGMDMSVSDAEKVVQITSDRINPGARIIWGASVDPNMEHEIRVMLVITGVTSRILEEHLTQEPSDGGQPRYKQVQRRVEGGYGTTGGDIGLDFIR
ncbi:MAG: cell division protein FtsZ [Candidatus Thermoplasmatota archaeon]|nr:cell division protein FtsZ [Candidatus Thermoplasmatota archaeon]